MILVTIPSCEQSASISLLDSDPHLARAFFTTYKVVKSLLSKANPTFNESALVPQPFLHSAASATAELGSCFILTPAEVLKQNAQMIRRPAGASTSKASTVFQPSVALQALKQFQTLAAMERRYSSGSAEPPFHCNAIPNV